MAAAGRPCRRPPLPGFLRLVALVILAAAVVSASLADVQQLNPKGKKHVPIGIPDSLDTVKTFVEAEGNFSPGFASYGIYFWLYQHSLRERGQLVAATQEGVLTWHGLRHGGCLVPYTTFGIPNTNVTVTSELSEIEYMGPDGEKGYVVGANVVVANTGVRDEPVALYLALRPIGAAGAQVFEVDIPPSGDTLLVSGQTAVVAQRVASAAGVSASDDIGAYALTGELPVALPGPPADARKARSDTGNCSAAMRFDAKVSPGGSVAFNFLFPVLAGRRTCGHNWNQWTDAAPLNAVNDEEVRLANELGCPRQPDPGADWFKANLIPEQQVGRQAAKECRLQKGSSWAEVPDFRWVEAYMAAPLHLALAMNNGSQDVALFNYQPFTRDGVYSALAMLRLGRHDASETIVRRFLEKPFNGRDQPEADNPGQVLWIAAQHWLHTQQRHWLQQVYPQVQKLVAMVKYYRTTPGPHWVNLDSNAFGDAVPEAVRKELKPGACDGYQPEYTEAFDIAGLRAAALMATAIEDSNGATEATDLAFKLFQEFQTNFEKDLSHGYGAYSVLWPTQLYPMRGSPAYVQFAGVGAQQPGDWLYFPLARAHQGLLAGNRDAGFGTVNAYLATYNMQGFYVMDEGLSSGVGLWTSPKLRTAWQPNVAMPHGWSMAELWHLLRDSLMHEDGDRLVLFAGAPTQWFKQTMKLHNFFSHFSVCSCEYEPTAEGNAIALKLHCSNPPRGGYTLRLPQSMKVKASASGAEYAQSGDGELLLPATATDVTLTFVQ